jgi:hypothetical protein
VSDSDPPDADWPRGWAEHTDAQRRRLARLPLVEKLRWLEEAQKLAEHLRRKDEPRSNPESRSE